MMHTGTQQPETVRFALDGRTIVLIDTPGFDDDNRSDVQILEDISKWMAEKGYLKSNQLDGLVLLHPVTMHRVGGTERRRTKLFQTILGEKAYKRVIIATTMWEQMVSENDVKERIAGREKDLWRDFVSKGSKVRRHQNNQESAHKIIREVIAMSEKYGKLEPLLHKELVMNPLLVESSAGRVTKEQLEAEIKRARELIREHEKKRPEQIQKRYRMIQQKKWKAWRCWNDEKKTLEQRLDSLQLQLKRLNSLSVSWFVLHGCRIGGALASRFSVFANSVIQISSS